MKRYTIESGKHHECNVSMQSLLLMTDFADDEYDAISELSIGKSVESCDVKVTRTS